MDLLFSDQAILYYHTPYWCVMGKTRAGVLAI
jgi:hypothetical protein